MRIHRLHAWNVAGIVDREVEFSAGTTVVEGPNESGKTTLLDAFGRLLAVPDSSQAKDVRRLRSKHRPQEGPEVEAEFSLGAMRVTYRKRWLVHPTTLAAIRHPDGRVERLAGGQAHERVEQLLDQHVDRRLWSAMRVPQGTGWTDPMKPGSIPSLLTLLDGLSGGARPDNATSLLSAVESEKKKYWTATWRPTKVYAEAQEAVDRAEGRHREVLGQREQAESLAQELARTRRDLPRLREQQVEAALRREQQDRELRAIDEAAAAVRAAELAEQQVHERHEAAKGAWASRARDVDQHQKAAAVCADTERRLEALSAQTRQLEDRSREVSERLEVERQVRIGAEASWAAANADLLLLAARREHEELLGRMERIGELEKRATQLAPDAARSEMLPAQLQEAERRAERLTAARARASAKLPRVQLGATEALEVLVGGQPIPVEAGGAKEWVQERVDIQYGPLRLRVISGVDAAQEARAQQVAEEALAACLREAGADSLATLRDRVSRAGVAREELARVQAEMARLGGEAPDGIGRRAAVLADRIDSLLREREAKRPLPATEEEAQDSLGEAEAVLKRQREQEAAVASELSDAEALLQTAIPERAAAQARLEEQQRQRDQMAARLLADRAAQSDEALEHAVSQAAHQITEAQSLLARERDQLSRLNPEAVRLQAANAREAAADADRRIHEAEQRYQRIHGSLEALGALGLDERLAEASHELEQAKAGLGRVRLQADAVRLLWDMVAQERDAAMVAYRKPYQEALERYGRTVFGPGFQVELDDELAVAARVDNGTPLEVDLLSTGAQEQMAILARAACAQLAGLHGEGVPLILDDAFGYSDPDRLEKLGAVLHDLDRSTQVIVMTCVPERYQWVAGARVVSVVRDREVPAGALPSPAEREAPDEEAAPRASSESSDLAGSVLDCLQAAGRPLSRSEILAETGLSEAAWTRTIHELLARGLVVQSGQRRGARYQHSA